MSKGTKNIAFYLMMIPIFGSLMHFIAKEGESRQLENSIASIQNASSNLEEGFTIFTQLLVHNIKSSAGILLLQIITILLTYRLFGWLFQKVGQPTVTGEIVVGIVLGPSILGNLFPEASTSLFPVESLVNIDMLSQFGLILFMFAIRMELNISEVRKKLKETILISRASTIVPFFSGMLTVCFVYDRYADKSVPFLSFALFMGIVMSITVFPVLARIIQEKELTKTHLGTISLTNAANGDIAAWCLLAVVITITRTSSILSAIYNILFSVLYIVFMFLAVRPFLRMIGHIYHNKEVINKGLVAFIFLLLITLAYLTGVLGLRALFGAFIAGVVVPGNVKFRKIVTEEVKDVSLTLFLPLFLVSTGLRMEIGFLNKPELWWLYLIPVVVIIAGKFEGAIFFARLVGESWKDSLYIGALMNTRGLMELVALTVGYKMGILTPSVFVILVLIAPITTPTTTPLVSFIKFCYRAHDKLMEQKGRMPLEGIFRVLLSSERTRNGQIMPDVAYQTLAQGRNKLELTALHLMVGSDVNPLHTDNFEEVNFGPILCGTKKLGIQIRTRYEVSSNAGVDICSIVNNEGCDFLLVGSGIPMSNTPDDITASHYRTSFYNHYFKRFKAPESWFYPDALLKDKTKMFIERSNCPVGVFMNRNFAKASNVIVVIDSEEDLFLLGYAQTLLKSTHGSANVLDGSSNTTSGNEVIRGGILRFTENVKQTTLLREEDLTPQSFNGFNFILISYETWNDVSEHRREALQKMPSTLILSK